uniref:Leucine rich repeat protein n=1 Tax=Panagrolaimus superbus TaxID=310955 RepID=A0A914YWA2_9BILA
MGNEKEIDCVKLQQIFSDLSLGHDEEGEPYRPLHMLELDYNEFETIQWELLPANLHSITLSYNRLKNIGNISHLTKLTMLSISSNQIESISDKIFDLPLLTNLSLDKNNLKELPKNFENFKSLMCLDLSENKFDFYKSNLDEVFWNRLPKNLRTLRISRNKIGILPCILRESKIEELHANECELFHICPYLYLKKVPLKELYISENGNLNNLPFIPQKIFQPPLLKDNDIKEKTKAAFIIITDKSDYIVTKPFPQKLLKPIYEFKILEEVPSFCGCNCCGNCGNKSDENIFIEQLMVMDFGLKMRVMNEEVSPITEKKDSYDLVTILIVTIWFSNG